MVKHVSWIAVRLTILIFLTGVLLSSEAHSKSWQATGQDLRQKAPSANQTPLNVVFIMTDDQRWDTLCGIPESLSQICQQPTSHHPMPTVEKELVAKGVRFTNALVTNPLCCPSRAGFLSGGFYAHHTNVLTNSSPNGGATKFADTKTVATFLQAQGYKTAIFGKYMNEYDHLIDWQNGQAYIPPGWNKFNATIDNWAITGSSSSDQPGTGAITELDPSIYVTDYLRDKALEFIDESCPIATCPAPFFLFLSTHDPHYPAIPAPRHENLFNDFIYRGRGWGEQPDGDVSDKPQSIQEIAKLWGDIEKEDNFHRNQLRTLRAVDEAVEAIITKLGEKNLLNDTVFIFTSDNGLHWGEHKLLRKALPYEESIRVPLVIKIPKVEPRSEDKLVAADLDIAPTILQLAGVTGIDSDGKSLLPLVVDPAIEWRHELLIQAWEEFTDPVPTWAAIKTDDNWKYAEYVTGEKELYNLVEDPYELNSKHEDPGYQGMIANLALKLQQLNRGIAIKTENLPDPQTERLPLGVKTLPYDFQLNAWGGNGDYRWSLYKADPSCMPKLPEGLTLTDAGRLSGLPAQIGAGIICIQVKDTSKSPQPGNQRPQSYITQFRLQIVLPKFIRNYLPVVLKGTFAPPKVSSFTAADPVPLDAAYAGNVEQIRTEFRKLKDLGINVVMQAFGPESTEADWQAYLDTATQEGLKVGVWFRESPPVWNGSNFDLGPNGVFLAAMKDHPALAVFLIIDEPFHRKHGQITGAQLQSLYQQAKAIAPNIPMAVQFSREIEDAETNNTPEYAFKDGMCDVCILSALAFRNNGNGNIFYKGALVTDHTISRAVIKREDPNAQIWSTVQVFGSADGSSSYYMPSPAELQEMLDILFSSDLRTAGELNGLIWQRWASPYTDQDASQHTLEDPEFEDLRNIVKNTAQSFNLLN